MTNVRKSNDKLLIIISIWKVNYRGIWYDRRLAYNNFCGFFSVLKKLIKSSNVDPIKR